MIIFLDLLEEELRSGLSEQIEIAINRLALVHKDGDHRVIMSRKTVEILTKYQWSPVVKATLLKIANEFTQVAQLLDIARWVLCIRSHTEAGRITRDNHKVILLTEFNRLRLHQPTVLLVENVETDGSLLCTFLETIGRRMGTSNLRIDRAHGGGDDIGSSFSSQVGNRRFVVCVVDSDMKSPFSPPAPKLRRLNRIRKELMWDYCYVVSLNCHEAENLLGPEIVTGLKCSVEYKDHGFVDKMKSKEDDPFGVDSFWRYFDVKNGIDNSTLEKLSGEPLEWLVGKLRLLEVDESTVNIAGFGDRVIPSFLGEVKKYDLVSKLISHNRYWVSAFREMFEALVWFFVGAPKSYA
jgi:hypothetical protein